MNTPIEPPSRRLLMWRGTRGPRMESVTLHRLGGLRLRATGRLLGAESDQHPAFSSTYLLEVDDAGRVARFDLTTQTAAGDKHLLLRRDDEGMWLVDADGDSSRVDFDGAVDLDCRWSPLFNGLMIRRAGLNRQPGEVTAPVIYVDIPEMTFAGREVTYRTVERGVQVDSPIYQATLQLDADGFVRDFPGLAERI